MVSSSTVFNFISCYIPHDRLRRSLFLSIFKKLLVTKNSIFCLIRSFATLSIRNSITGPTGYKDVGRGEFDEKFQLVITARKATIDLQVMCYREHSRPLHQNALQRSYQTARSRSHQDDHCNSIIANEMEHHCKFTMKRLARLKDTLTKLNHITIMNSPSVITRKIMSVLVDQIEVLHLHQDNPDEMTDGVHLNLSAGEEWKALREVQLRMDHGSSFWMGIWYLNRNRMNNLQSLDFCVNMEEGWDTVNDTFWDALKAMASGDNLNHFRMRGKQRAD